MKPKLIRKIDGKNRWHRVEYELECVNCGATYIRHSFGKNTSPICTSCSQRIQREKQKQRQISKALEPIRAEIEREADHYDAYVNADIAKGLYYAGEIIDKYTNGGLTQAEIEHYNKLAEHYNQRRDKSKCES